MLEFLGFLVLLPIVLFTCTWIIMSLLRVADKINDKLKGDD